MVARSFVERLREIADGKTHVQLSCKFGQFSCVIVEIAEDYAELVTPVQSRHSATLKATRMVVRLDEIIGIMVTTPETTDREVSNVIDTFLSGTKSGLSEDEMKELGLA